MRAVTHLIQSVSYSESIVTAGDPISPVPSPRIGRPRSRDSDSLQQRPDFPPTSGRSCGPNPPRQRAAARPGSPDFGPPDERPHCRTSTRVGAFFSAHREARRLQRLAHTCPSHMCTGDRAISRLHGRSYHDSCGSESPTGTSHRKPRSLPMEGKSLPKLAPRGSQADAVAVPRTADFVEKGRGHARFGQTSNFTGRRCRTSDHEHATSAITLARPADPLKIRTASTIRNTLEQNNFSASGPQSTSASRA